MSTANASTKTETLGDLRREANKRTRQVAEALGVTQPRITQIEQEGTKDIEQIEALAAFYDIEPDRVRLAARHTRALYENR